MLNWHRAFGHLQSRHSSFLLLPWAADSDRKSWQGGKGSKVYTASIRFAVKSEAENRRSVLHGQRKGKAAPVRACALSVAFYFICSFFLKLEFFPCTVTCITSNDPFITTGADSTLT